jgi:hypothetical protein
VKKLAVIMNVVSNTRIDLVTRGAIKGVLESGREPREVDSHPFTTKDWAPHSPVAPRRIPLATCPDAKKQFPSTVREVMWPPTVKAHKLSQECKWSFAKEGM